MPVAKSFSRSGSIAAAPPTVRPLAAADAAEAAALIRAAFAAQPRPTAPPSSALRETDESVAVKIAAGGGFGVAVGGRLVALALWSVVGDALQIGRLSVLPEARGAGLARRLVGACADAAREQGRGSLTLRVRLELPENERMFERLGFRRYGLDVHSGFGAPTVALMEKRLP